MHTVTYIRYAEESGRFIEETHTFTEVDSGFSLDAVLFPAEVGKQFMTTVQGNALYDEAFDKDTYPLNFAVRAGVTLYNDKESYETARSAAITTARQASQDASTAVEDARRIFLIDFNGSGVINNPDRREHFKLLYGFDPVDDDPRN